MEARSKYAVSWLVAGSALLGSGLAALAFSRPSAGLFAAFLGLPFMVAAWQQNRRKNLEGKAVDSGEQLRACARLLLNKLPASMLMLDAADRIVFANERAREMFGRSKDAWNGQSLAALADAKAHETDAGLGPVRRFRKADGTLLYAHVSESEMTPVGSEGAMRLLVVSDVTPLMDMHRQLQHAERLRTVANMAAQFAHEVRNPVAAISGSAQMLDKIQREAGGVCARKGVSDEERAQLFQCIVSESDRLDGIVAKFLSVANFSDEQLSQLLRVSDPPAYLASLSTPHRAA